MNEMETLLTMIIALIILILIIIIILVSSVFSKKRAIKKQEKGKYEGWTQAVEEEKLQKITKGND